MVTLIGQIHYLHSDVLTIKNSFHDSGMLIIRSAVQQETFEIYDHGFECFMPIDAYGQTHREYDTEPAVTEILQGIGIDTNGRSGRGVRGAPFYLLSLFTIYASTSYFDESFFLLGMLVGKSQMQRLRSVIRHEIGRRTVWCLSFGAGN